MSRLDLKLNTEASLPPKPSVQDSGSINVAEDNKTDDFKPVRDAAESQKATLGRLITHFEEEKKKSTPLSEEEIEKQVKRYKLKNTLSAIGNVGFALANMIGVAKKANNNVYAPKFNDTIKKHYDAFMEQNKADRDRYDAIIANIESLRDKQATLDSNLALQEMQYKDKQAAAEKATAEKQREDELHKLNLDNKQAEINLTNTKADNERELLPYKKNYYQSQANKNNRYGNGRSNSGGSKGYIEVYDKDGGTHYAKNANDANNLALKYGTAKEVKSDSYQTVDKKDPLTGKVKSETVKRTTSKWAPMSKDEVAKKYGSKPTQPQPKQQPKPQTQPTKPKIDNSKLKSFSIYK